MALTDRIRRVLNTFLQNEPDIFNSAPGPSSSRPPEQRVQRFSYNDKSIVSSVYNRIAMDVAGVQIKHVRTEDRRYADDMESSLQDCFILEANLDQGPRQFRQDAALTLFDLGVVAIVPVDYTTDENDEHVVDITTMRVGEIREWFPRHIRASVYNDDEKVGRRQDVILQKSTTAIVQNPFYAVMNDPSGISQRLMRKLSLLDSADEAAASGKLDLIIQLPYVARSETKKQLAAQRAADIEFQMKGSEYGVVYLDGTEKITQLNRPAENNLLKQIEYLVNLLYSQFGVTPEIMNGTADEATMLNYYNRTVITVVEAFVEAEIRAFIGRVGMSRQEWIMYFTDPFKFVPLSQLADIVDKFARNRVMTSNEFRQKLGLKPSTDPEADKLVNANMPQTPPSSEVQPSGGHSQNESQS